MVAEGSGTTQAEVGIEGDQAAVESAVVEGVQGDAVPGVEAGTVKDKGDKFLTQLCEETGGEAFFTGDMIELERAFTRISQELRSQYIITYRPANQNYDGKDRKIEVRFADKEKGKDLKIRTKTSYRAIKDSLK